MSEVEKIVVDFMSFDRNSKSFYKLSIKAVSIF